MAAQSNHQNVNPEGSSAGIVTEPQRPRKRKRPLHARQGTNVDERQQLGVVKDTLLADVNDLNTIHKGQSSIEVSEPSEDAGIQSLSPKNQGHAGRNQVTQATPVLEMKSDGGLVGSHPLPAAARVEDLSTNEDDLMVIQAGKHCTFRLKSQDVSW